MCACLSRGRPIARSTADDRCDQAIGSASCPSDRSAADDRVAGGNRSQIAKAPTVSELLPCALPDDSTNEKRTKSLEIQRRLLRRPHLLNNRRQRKQLLANQSDDKVVVLFVQPVTREANVVGEVRRAE